jgi:hypothetical protein
VLNTRRQLFASRREPEVGIMTSLAVRALFICAALSCAAQTSREPYTFFKFDLSVCAKDSSQPDEKGFYLITVKGSRQAGLTGPKGSIVRKKAISKISSSLETSLTHIKGVLENKQ